MVVAAMLCSTAAAEGDGRAVRLGVAIEAVLFVPPALASAVSTLKDGEPLAVAVDDPGAGKNSLDDATEVGLVDFRPVLLNKAVGLNNRVVVVE